MRHNDSFYPATLSPFELDTYEVTVGRFRAFVEVGFATAQTPPPIGAGAHPFAPSSGWDIWYVTNLELTVAALKAALHCGPAATWTDTPCGHENLPINCATWYEAFAFCAWEGGYLPSEAQWGFAAVGGDQQRDFSWGDALPDPPHAVFDCTGDGSVAGSCSPADIQPVGSRSPLGDGLWGQHDLNGNLVERHMDGVGSDLIMPCNDCVAGVSLIRTAGGGAYDTGALGIANFQRQALGASSRYEVGGFRCAH